MKSRKKKIIIITAVTLAAVLILVPLSYLLYVVISYERLPDNLSLEVKGEATEAVPTDSALSLVSYNIGFGAYSADYSFFMDGGEYSRAYSADAVRKNTGGALETLKAQNADFILLQEVDTDGTRSYHIDQTEIFAKSLVGFDYSFAQNYNSPYFLYPFNQPIGANKSGIMTFSAYDISSSLRRSLPIEESLYKYLDLDRAYSVSMLKTDNGKMLALYNVHLSAYTSDGSIADEQIKLLANDIKEQYAKGNYVVVAGDFNKDMLGDSSKYFKRTEGDFTWAKPFNSSLLPEGFTAYSGENAPTCRNADSAFRGDGTDFVLSVDGVIVSDNVEVVLCETVDNAFEYSDHNPVKLEFVLKG